MRVYAKTDIPYLLSKDDLFAARGDMVVAIPARAEGGVVSLINKDRQDGYCTSEQFTMLFSLAPVTLRRTGEEP